MGSYIANFAVYTMAMTGLIFFAVFAYKKFMNGGFRKDSSNFLSIEESMNINPRKSLLVVRAGSEKFLIASDVDRTTLLSKLDETSSVSSQKLNLMRDKYVEYIPEQIQEQVPEPVIVQPEKEPVRLDVIREKNPLGRKMDTREHVTESKTLSPKTVTLNFDKPVNHGFSTMKEMAKKINEL
ncbi:FliO/MopB family protein [bacterium]|nr:FliO/MopB family protein [bacterium]